MSQDYINVMNIAGEGVMCAVLFLVLISCFFQRREQETIKALKALIITDILLLFCQMAQWFMLIDTAPDYIAPIKLAYTADYFLYYLTAVLFYNYARLHINVKKVKKDISFRLFVVFGIILTALFIMIINNESLYLRDIQGNEVYIQVAYWILYLLANSITFFAAANIIRHRKLLGRLDFCLLLSYSIVPPCIAIADINNRTCLSYLMQAFFILIIYVLIDLRRERELSEKEKLILVQEKELTELNTKIMLSQIQPHFLNNVLGTISGLCYMDGAHRAKDVVDRFAVYMRENLDALGSKKYISFSRELNHIETYLWLEQIRFGDALSVEYDIEVSDFMIPSLSVQPLVENAVKHGIRRKKGGGMVRVVTREMPKEHLVIVTDSGAGFDTDSIWHDEKSHVGIENVRRRIKRLCGGSCDIVSKPGEGTTVTLHIPKEAEK